MHPVINNIRARRGKKAPFDDGRKITLVLYGGIMLGARGAGALRGLEELDLGNVFDSIYTMSSGFLNGSYFLSGQIAEGAAIYPEEFSGKAFLNRKRFWKVADTDYLVRVLSEKRPLNVNAALANPTKLYAMMINADKGTQEYLEVHDYPPEEYFNMVRASASLPFVGKGTTKIGGVRYRDIFRDGNLPDMMNQVLRTNATDIFVLYNYPWQKEYVDKKTGLTRQNLRVFEFCPCPEPMSRFETDAELLRRTAELARTRMSILFADKK
jgi:predicted patatin/cPLA2 family phospholipase